MENSKKKSGGVEIPKRNRSLDLKSLYESAVSKVGGSKKKVSDDNDQEDVKKKRKSRREVSLSCFESDAKRSRKEHVDGMKSELGFRQRSSGESEGLHGFSLTLSDNGSAFNIPKRPRGTLRRKKLESDQVSQPLELQNSVDCVGALKAEVSKSEDKAGSTDRLVRSVTLSTGNDGVPKSKSTGKVSGSNLKSKQNANSKSTVNSSSSDVKLKRKAGADEVKESRNGRPGSVRHVVKEDNLVVNNGDTSSKKRRSNSRKKKDLVVGRDGGEASLKKSEPSAGSSVSDSLLIDLRDDDDDDEENLEQNAARMLSSRFDPSCTGFSSKSKTSVSQTADGFSFPVSCGLKSFSRQANLLVGRRFASPDNESRALRPRREDKGKGLSRKRRHFYEILPGDLNAYWVLNRRIKIFWPLDESWYYGLVDDYHPDSKVHHIKYDDRDEEWVDLQEEKFKLLLLPSEVPGREKSKTRSTGDKDLHIGQATPPADDDSCMGKYLDSEPIASWLASSSQRVKALPKSSKRRRTSQKPLSLVSSLSSEKTDNSNGDVADSKRTRSRPHCESASVDSLVHGTVDKSLLGTTSGSRNGEHVVYVRKKYHKKSEGGSSISRDFKTCGSAPPTFTPTISSTTTKEGKFDHSCMDSDKQMWSFDDIGKLRLNDVFVESKEFRFHVCLPLLPFLEFSCGRGVFGLLHDIFMLQHGVVTTTSPAVILEMLFVDSNLGLRFLLFEGCLKQALVFVFLILNAYSQSDKHRNVGMKLPVTSIRFRLSRVQDLRKQHAFAFYSFSRLQSSTWLCPDSEILPHCLIIKQLPVSECTYDNIKELGCGSFEQCKPLVGLEISSNEGFKNKFVPGILPIGVSREACNTWMSQSEKPGKVPQFALPFSAAPTFFLTLHLQLLMEHSFAWVNLQHQDALLSLESSETRAQPVAECSQFETSSVSVQDVTDEHEIEKLDTEAPAFRAFSSSEQDLGMDVVFANNVVKNTHSSEKLQKGIPDDAGTAGYFKEFTEIVPEVIAQSHQCESKKAVHEPIVVSASTYAPTSITSASSNPRSNSTSGGMIIDIPSFEQVDVPFDGKGLLSRKTFDVDWNVHDGFVHNPNPTGSKRLLQRGISSSISSPIGHHSPVWPDWKPNFMPNGFSNGPKKPRTQVQYTLPFDGYDFSEKQKTQDQRSLPCKRIRRASLKRISDGSGNNQKNLELQTCAANVLVTIGDKGWRECGAHIVLEVADHNEWRLAVKLSGVTKYSYKVKHIFQPGSTNRYSHAMMWKGGKDWVLEFPDRSQWNLFKEMHEECYNRNIRAASVKNIPIPGVRIIEESDDYVTEVPFVRNSTKYFRQIQTDVEMAMDPSHILYDLDSDDEHWLMANKNCTDKHRYEEISEEFLERTIDVFEKFSYVQLRDNFTAAEIEELLIGIGSVEAAKVIYEHWRQKRERKGMPLIRHLQPPFWERYQHQLKEWEHTVARGNRAFSVGSQEKVPPPEKPPMFAFCLKPRGLDVPNKGSKQRSHRRFPVSGHHHTSSGDQDNLLVFGRRLNGHAFGDEKVLYASGIRDSSDVSPSLRASTRVLSPQDAHFSLSTGVSEWKRNPKVYKNKPKKLGPYPSFHNQQMMSYNQRATENTNGVVQLNLGFPKLSSQRHYYFEGPHKQRVEHLDGSDIHEFRLRDASGAAQHALNMAKLKRERAQRLVYRADLAIHKAVVALMTAEAIKDSSENSNSVN